MLTPPRRQFQYRLHRSVTECTSVTISLVYTADNYIAWRRTLVFLQESFVCLLCLFSKVRDTEQGGTSVLAIFRGPIVHTHSHSQPANFFNFFYSWTVYTVQFFFKSFQKRPTHSVDSTLNLCEINRHHHQVFSYMWQGMEFVSSRLADEQFVVASPPSARRDSNAARSKVVGGNGELCRSCNANFTHCCPPGHYQTNGKRFCHTFS